MAGKISASVGFLLTPALYGDRDVTKVECLSCGAELLFDLHPRVVQRIVGQLERDHVCLDELSLEVPV